MTDSNSSTRELLREASNEQLEPLVECILKTSSESLSKTASYKRYSPDHSKYSDEILHELRLMGGHSMRNIFRKEGPDYIEVVRDVAEKVGVKKVKSFSSVEELELEMIETMLRKMAVDAKGADKEELEKLLFENGMKQTDIRKFVTGSALGSLLGYQMSRYLMAQVSYYVAASITRQILGRAVMLGTAGMAGTRAVAALAGPVGWAIGGAWMAFDVAGPAFRVTVPGVLCIATLRLGQKSASEAEAMRSAFDD